MKSLFLHERVCGGSFFFLNLINVFCIKIWRYHKFYLGKMVLSSKVTSSHFIWKVSSVLHTFLFYFFQFFVEFLINCKIFNWISFLSIYIFWLFYEIFNLICEDVDRAVELIFLIKVLYLIELSNHPALFEKPKRILQWKNNKNNESYKFFCQTWLFYTEKQ